MIKAIIFDLDGVLVDARELHYIALNKALEVVDKKFMISRDEHLSTFDGLPTSRKLEYLTQKKGLDKNTYDRIWKSKQTITHEIINKEFTYDERMRGILRRLCQDGYKIVVCSNSIRDTTKMMLLRKGLMEFVEFFISNQDVLRPKPNPEIYLNAMIKLGIGPRQCVIVEDSHVGRQAAFEAGAHVCPVENPDAVTYEKIKDCISRVVEQQGVQDFKPKWQQEDLRILIPIAGEGKRFKEMGYTFPKCLIDISGKPMIEWVIQNISADVKFIFLVRREDLEKYNLQDMLRLLAPNSEIIGLKNPTRGAAETVLAAEHLINDNKPLAIINGDQYMQWNSNEFFYSMVADQCDGGIVTFESVHPKWSFVKIAENGFVSETAEKKPISNKATAGVYYFKKGSEFVKYARQMIEKGITTNSEYYVCPVYNEMISDGKKIRSFPIKNMWSFATPEDVKEFADHFKRPVS